MSRKRTDVVFVSFFTPNYTQRAERLKASLDGLHLTHDIVAIKDQGGFLANVSYKPRFIGEMMEKHPNAKAIVWLDADATVLGYPRLFWELYGIDLAVHFRDGVELVASTMYWANTKKSMTGVAMWAVAMDAGAGRGRPCPEQQVLQENLVNWNIALYMLPTEYCTIPDLPPETTDGGRKIEPLIAQWQASRTERYRGTVNGPRATRNREPEGPADLTIAVLLPSRGRPENVTRLLSSIQKTARVPSRVHTYIRIDNDDGVMGPHVMRLRNACPTPLEFQIGPRVPLAAMWNSLWASADADIYMFCADDSEFESEAWDEQVAAEFWKDRLVLVFGDDGLQHENLATHWFVSHEACERLGYFCKPEYEAIYMDTWIDDIYRRAGKMRYLPDMKITHHHWTITGKIDEPIARDRDGRKARDKVRYEAGEAARQADAEKLGVRA